MFANIILERIFIMRRPITYAELILILIFVPMVWIGGTNLYEFVSDRIYIEVRLKK
tara:strand:+ start:6228 stop:6395 length:168 start_codon:yes stop_codon:yes gene_type:complete